jgi:hypothetical protein
MWVTIIPKGEGHITDLGAGGVQRKMWDKLRSMAGNILDGAIRTIAHGGGQEYHLGQREVGNANSGLSCVIDGGGVRWNAKALSG